MTSAEQWRRRCVAAEERASIAERRAERFQRRAGRLAASLREITEARNQAFHISETFKATIEELAQRQLGETAMTLEVETLVDVWIRETVKRAQERHRVRRPDSAPVEIHMSMRLPKEEFFRRLGFSPPDEDDDS